MSEVFLLSKKQCARRKPYVPRSHGVPRVDDLRVVSGIIDGITNGLPWKDAPREYGSPPTLSNRFVRWSRMGVFDRLGRALAGARGTPDRLRIDATHRKAHRTTARPAPKRAVPRCIGRTNGGLNSTLQAVCDGDGRPVDLPLTAGQASDSTGARSLLHRLPQAKELIADCGYDADWFRAVLKGNGLTPGIPPRKHRKAQRCSCKTLSKPRHTIENMCAKLKDGRCIAMRDDRWAHPFFSAICMAATVIFYLN